MPCYLVSCRVDSSQGYSSLGTMYCLVRVSTIASLFPFETAAITTY